ncbi:hypothetical protein DLH72_04545 [Candidatus Gracilibacteria bacterium]|nr:MAG: hypothetical protein DLH72_04545 [Candidatus Gracilibacteria bacterium]
MKNVSNHAVLRYYQRFLNRDDLQTNDDLYNYSRDFNNKKEININKTKILRYGEDSILIDITNNGLKVYYNKSEDMIFIVDNNVIVSVYKADGISYDKDLINIIYV